MERFWEGIGKLLDRGLGRFGKGSGKEWEKLANGIG